MNAWSELGIPATQDLRVIKQAYAKKLKVTRPDEKPTEFQKLHEAYQYAIAIAKRQIANNVIESPREPNIQIAGEQLNTTHNVVESDVKTLEDEENISSEATTSESKELPQEENPFFLEEERLLKICRALLQEDQTLIRQVDSWRFLEQSPFLLDPRFCWHIGVRIFAEMDRHYRSGFYINNGSTWPILEYLDALFGWRQNRFTLEQAVGKSACSTLFPLIGDYESEDRSDKAIESLRGSNRVKRADRVHHLRLEEIHLADFLIRFFAFLIDFALIFPLMIGISKLVENWLPIEYKSIPSHSLYLSFGLFMIAVWLFECSKWGCTPGKYILGLKVINHRLERLGYLHGLLRTGVFSSGIILVLLFTHGGLIALIWIPVLIAKRLNFNFTAGGGNAYDVLSRTWVINYRRSLNEKKNKK